MFGRILQPGSRQRPFVIAAIILVGIILVGLLAIGAISLFRKSAGEASPTPMTPIVTPTKSATPRPSPTATRRATNTPVVPLVTPTSEGTVAVPVATEEGTAQPTAEEGQPTQPAVQPSATPVPPDATTPNTGSSTLILLAAVAVAVVLVAVRRMRTAH